MIIINKRISIIILLFVLLSLPVAAQFAQRASSYKIGVCDWMILKRQKIGAFQLARELGSDGLEMDMGGLGKRDTFDNKLSQPYFQKLFKETAEKYCIDVPSVAMSGFFGQSFVAHSNYKALVADCLNTMKIMGAKVAFLPLGGISGNWKEQGETRHELLRRLHEVGEMAFQENLQIGIRTSLSAEDDIKLLQEINSKGIKIYYSFQDALEASRDICKELERLGKERICQIHCTDTDRVTLPFNKRLDLKRVKKTLDEIGWSGWLIVERSRDKEDVRNVQKNYGTNIEYLKEVFQK